MAIQKGLLFGVKDYLSRQLSVTLTSNGHTEVQATVIIKDEAKQKVAELVADYLALTCPLPK